ncbi:MAG: tetratricopeptide repeat protein, partial [Alphaproteobacteria bacterium]
VEASDGQIQGGGAGLQLSYALLLEQKADYDGAVKVYEKLADARPDSFIVANNLASLLVDRFPTEANIERALQVAKRLRESEVPQYQDTYGWILYLRGEAEQALRYLQPAAEAMPNLMLAQYHLGMAYAKAGIDDRAITALNRAIELAGDDASVGEQLKTARATLETLQKSANKEN